jgi:hypothetical protein
MSGVHIPRKLHGKNGNMITGTATISSASLAETIAGCLQRSWGGLRHSAKLLAQQIDSNPRTAANLLEGRNAPSAATLVQLMKVDDNVFEIICQLADRPVPGGPLTQLTAEERRVLTKAFRLIDGGGQ